MDSETPTSASGQPGSSEADDARQRHLYRALAASAVALVAVSTGIYMLLEDWGFVDALYFCVVAGTTVGFGDLSPSTDASKLFTIVYLFSSVSIFATYLNMRLKHHAYRRARHHTARRPSPDADDADPSGNQSAAG